MRYRFYADGVAVRACTLGRGLFALRAFEPDELIVRLNGPKVDRNDPLHSFPEGANLLQTGRKSYILLEPPGVYANHSCDPNAGIRQNRYLTAIRSIVPDEEICFDYSTTMDEDYWIMPCACGKPECREVVRDFKMLASDLQRRYLSMNVVQRFIARRYHRHLPTPANEPERLFG